MPSLSCISLYTFEIVLPFVVMDTQFSITFYKYVGEFCEGFVEGHNCLLDFYGHAIGDVFCHNCHC